MGWPICARKTEQKQGTSWQLRLSWSLRTALPCGVWECCWLSPGPWQRGGPVPPGPGCWLSCCSRRSNRSVGEEERRFSMVRIALMTGEGCGGGLLREVRVCPRCMHCRGGTRRPGRAEPNQSFRPSSRGFGGPKRPVVSAETRHFTGIATGRFPGMVTC